LAAAPTSGALLATTEAGLLASSDTGATWRTLSPPVTALLVTWADEKTMVIATTTGQLGVSSDAGITWTLNPTRVGAAEALHAGRGQDGRLEIVVVADGKVLRTLDGDAILTRPSRHHGPTSATAAQAENTQAPAREDTQGAER
jgi:photosystem II stability/assembly factor-like uncharacterized protein